MVSVPALHGRDRGLRMCAAVIDGRCWTTGDPPGYEAPRRHDTRMVGRLEKAVLDCPDPRALARFYAQILGMRIQRSPPTERASPTSARERAVERRRARTATSSRFGRSPSIECVSVKQKS